MTQELVEEEMGLKMRTDKEEGSGMDSQTSLDSGTGADEDSGGLGESGGSDLRGSGAASGDGGSGNGTEAGKETSQWADLAKMETQLQTLLQAKGPPLGLQQPSQQPRWSTPLPSPKILHTGERGVNLLRGTDN